MNIDDDFDDKDHLENTKGNEDDGDRYFSRVPIDRGWAWVTVFGAFGICSLVGGVLKSFGVLLLELSRRYEAPASLLTSSQSLCGALHLGLGPVSNALSVRFTHRKIVFVGGLVAGLGLILTAFIQKVEPFFITYGIITGTGFGLCISPSLVFPGMHFKKRLAIANGFAAAGTGAGAFVFPNLMRFLLDKYSLEGCLLILGAIIFNACVYASFFRPLSFWTKSKYQNMPSFEVKQFETLDRQTIAEGKLLNQSFNTANEVDNRVSASSGNIPKVINNMQYDSVCSSSVPCLKRELDTHRQSQFNNLRNDNTGKSMQSHSKYLSHSALVYASIDSLPLTVLALNRDRHNNSKLTKNDNSIKKKQKKLINWKILKNSAFQVLNVGIFFGIYAHHTIYNFIPLLANEIGLSDTEGALCVSIVGLTDLIGRMSAGLLSDTFCQRRQITFQLCMFIFGCSVLILAHMNTFIRFCIMCAFSGVFTGGYVGIQIAVLAEILGMDELSSAWGFVAFFSSMSILINPAVAGAIKDTTGSWIPAFYLGSVSAIAGACILFFDTRLKCQNKCAINQPCK